MFDKMNRWWIILKMKRVGKGIRWWSLKWERERVRIRRWGPPKDMIVKDPNEESKN